MPRKTTILQVFVASPNNVKEERIALESVIRELNQTQSEMTGAYLELIKWETHTVPGLGSDPQAVINEQIGEAYDIFIGLLSTKFGTATPRAGSGTEEEFDLAYVRFNKSPNELRVMFYFKDPELRASELDLDQYGRVKEFQKKLGQKGLYSTFNTTDEFVAMVRMHLSRLLQDWAAKKWGGEATSAATAESVPQTDVQVETIEIEEELGLLDLAELVNENLQSATASLARIGKAIEDLGRRTSENTPKFKEATAQKDLTRQKQVLNHVARAMEEFSVRLDAEIPLFSNPYTAAIDAISKSATLWETDFKSNDTTSIQETHDQVEGLLESIVTNQASMLEMQEAIEKLPRLTASSNKAKRHAAESLINLNRVLTSSYNLTKEVHRELKHILGR